MTNGKVISIINMKGGVGKTSLSLGLSSYFSNEIGGNKKILLIDIDPQFNATQGLIDTDDYYENIRSNDKTIYQLFKLQTDLSQGVTIPKNEDIICNVKNNDNLDIICGDLNLVLVNKTNDYSLVKRLKKFIKENHLKEIYDYIFIDCPPTLTVYTDSALMSSDYYIIPNKIDVFSTVGVDLLNQAVSSLISDEDLDLKCAGLIYTMVENQLSAKQLEIKKKIEESIKAKNIYTFKSNMSWVRDLQVGKQGPIATNYSKSRKDIMDIANELEGRI